MNCSKESMNTLARVTSMNVCPFCSLRSGWDLKKASFCWNVLLYSGQLASAELGRRGSMQEGKGMLLEWMILYVCVPSQVVECVL